MSDPVSYIKNTSGSVNAIIENTDTVEAAAPFDTLTNKLQGVCKDQFPFTKALSVTGTKYDGAYIENKNGTIVPVETSAYYYVVFPASGLVGKTLEFCGLHDYGSVAFAICDSKGNVLVGDGADSNAKASNVHRVVVVPNNAASIYMSFNKSYYPPSTFVAELYEVKEYKTFPTKNNGQYSIVEPDKVVVGRYINGQISPGEHARFLSSSGYALAFKALRKGTLCHILSASQRGESPVVVCDEGYVVSMVFTATENDAEAQVIDSFFIMPCDGYVIWNYITDQQLAVKTDETGQYPYVDFLHNMFDYELSTGRYVKEIEWDDTREGYYSYNGYPFAEYSGVKVSKPISTGAGNSYVVSGYLWAGVPLIVFLDEDMNPIGSQPHSNFNGREFANTTRYIREVAYAPAGSAYFVLQDASGANPLIKSAPSIEWYYGSVKVSKGKAYLNTPNVLYGKKYVACGDSFTSADNLGADHYDDRIGCYESYAWMIADRNGMIYSPNAISGSRMTNVDGVAKRAFSLDRYKNIPEDADYITLMFGLNEPTFCDNPKTKGTEGSTDNTTVWGAWDVVLEWILTNRPKARVGIIISDAWMTQSYAQTLIEIANYWGVPYLDLGGDPKVPLMNGGRRTGSGATCSKKAAELRNRQHYQSYPDDSHPNYDGHVWRSTVVENFLRSL